MGEYVPVVLRVAVLTPKKLRENQTVPLNLYVFIYKDGRYITTLNNPYKGEEGTTTFVYYHHICLAPGISEKNL